MIDSWISRHKLASNCMPYWHLRRIKNHFFAEHYNQSSNFTSSLLRYVRKLEYWKKNFISKQFVSINFNLQKNRQISKITRLRVVHKWRQGLWGVSENMSDVIYRLKLKALVTKLLNCWKVWKAERKTLVELSQLRLHLGYAPNDNPNGLKGLIRKFCSVYLHEIH